MFTDAESSILVPGKLLSGRRILVVEDEMLVLMTIESTLADLGCESVAAAATVDQARRSYHLNFDPSNESDETL